MIAVISSAATSPMLNDMTTMAQSSLRNMMKLLR
jgi:hypothetical protein